MRRLFAVVLVICLWFGFAAPASAGLAGDNVSGLTPCSENAAFQKRADGAKTESAKARFAMYGRSNVLCGPEGLPHLVVSGDLSHAGEFIIPSILFLYIAGFIGWAGRSYIMAVRAEKNPEEKEVVIELPLAIKCALGAFAWPLVAFKEITTGEMFAKENEITVSPR
ncbi:Photosystem I reaction center subunit III [Pseudanabaena sp. FACHB-2040]|uniref:Photosystem I reaction center subunit III n=1 Tax=Pseudanabaena sp. FACHB-2040 TaxID=2692859 RepID=UPI001688AD2D|nr:Photosystem I reaction center subunit III [Pseudanabaena sp. FACHB-2040]MBD2258841.1 Photosystem I reaction center subunit III [Pseudanabaena sp. FACHB-2040]